MEEKRKDAGNQPAASSSAVSAGTPSKISDAAPVADPPSSRRRGGGQKRKASGGYASTPPTTSSKRQAREKASAFSHPPIHNGPCTRARQSPSTAAAAASVSETSSSAGVVKNEAVHVAPLESRGGEAVRATEETSAVEEDWKALEAKIEAEYALIRSRDVNAHVVPIPAGWFSWIKIHPLEERSLPSFFNGNSESRTPEIYMEIRNWIVGKFHANPNTQIELKDLSELSVGEMDARQEVMEFLDHWGLINYHPFPENDPTTENMEGNGTAKMDSLVEKLYSFGTEQPCTQVVPRTNVATPALPSGLFPEPAIAEDLVRPEGPAVEYHCNSCSADCSRKRYHCQKQADFDLCSECFNNGKFDSDMSPADFILMEPAEAAGVSGGKWTDQETLLLLEALELYKENWNEIAEHVATKTKAQCILHFVQMPIEDTFMDFDDEVDDNLKENVDPATANTDSSAPNDAKETTESRTGADENQPESSPVEILKPEKATELEVAQETCENCVLKALKEAFESVGSFPPPEGQFSFAEAGNPVMALAAFLVRMVEPNVATALARSSVKSISGNSSSVQLAARHCFLLDDPHDDKKKSADSERVVDPVEENAYEKKKEEKSISVLDGGDLPNHSNDKDKASASEEKEHPICPEDRSTEQSRTVKDSDVISTCKGGLHSSTETANPDFLTDHVTTDAKESNDLMPEVEPHPRSEEAGDRNLVATRTDEGNLESLNELNNSDLPKDPSAQAAKDSDDLTPKEEIPSCSAKESGDKVSEEGSSQCIETAKDAVVASDSLPVEKNEPEQLIMPNSNTDSGNTGEDEKKDSTNDDEEPTNTKDDQNIDKVKRAAATALSAAAVKAKLLAEEEEDQIRKLATLLIEKQLHKLETKLAFFSEMENVVMRVREQMERSKQVLYQERAQIIAARFAYQASASRQPLPINRVAMGFASSAAKPLTSVMASQRPPISRSAMPFAPPISSTFVPSTPAGNPVRPTNQDTISSVVTK